MHSLVEILLAVAEFIFYDRITTVLTFIIVFIIALASLLSLNTSPVPTRTPAPNEYCRVVNGRILTDFCITPVPTWKTSQ